MNPPIVGGSKANYGFGRSKNVLDFLKKNLSSRIYPKVDTDYPRGTGNSEIVAYHYHGTTQTIKTSYFRPVCHETKIRLVNSDYKNYLI